MQAKDWLQVKDWFMDHGPTDDDLDVNRIVDAVSYLGRQWRRGHEQLQSSTKGALSLCLAVLGSQGPMRSGALADFLGTDPSTISRQVAALVERGLVRRAADPHDGRISVLEVTDDGRAMVADMRQRRTGMVHRVMREFSLEDRARLAELLTRFVDGYRRAYPDTADIGSVFGTPTSAQETVDENGESA